MESLCRLRRHLVKGESISALARNTHLSRNIVREYVRAQSAEPRYVHKQQLLPRLGPFRKTLTAGLKTERRRPVREQRTAMRLFDALRKEGYRRVRTAPEAL